MKLTEEQIAAPVVEWLTELKWEVYQEVQLFSGSKIADIVATNGSIVWVLEVKKSLSWHLVDQARAWNRRANLISIVTPKRSLYGACREFLAWAGIGFISSRPSSYESLRVTEFLRPRLNRTALTDWSSRLCEEHKTFAVAGNANGQRWSPFTQTVRAVHLEVERSPGITLKELVEKIDHHYGSTSSAKNSLVLWIRKGVIKGIRIDKTTRPYRLFRDGDAEPTPKPYWR